MKTLAELKRLPKGTKLRLVSRYGKPVDEEREVLQCRSNDIIFLVNGKKSWCQLPPASRVEFTENGFRLYGIGKRPLTDEERRVLNNQPKDDKQAELDMMTDTNVMFWRQKDYFIKQGMKHLLVYNEGTHLVYDDKDTPMIKDIHVKGELELEYVLEGGGR